MSAAPDPAGSGTPAERRPALVVLGGLPGTGKTTVAKALAARRRAAYLRVDEIEHALRRDTALGAAVGPAGYIVAFALARSNLALGLPVVADCVNPVPDSREGWRSVAVASSAQLLEVEIVCGDAAEHQRRVETRRVDIEGFEPPSWASVMAHDYVPWDTDRLVIDTAALSPAAAVAEIEARIGAGDALP